MIDKGRILSNRYELLDLCGSGGSGVVYKAWDRDLDRAVAIKVLHPHLAEEPSYVSRFHREIIVARALSAKNTVRVLGSGHDGILHYMVMEFVEAPTLRDFIKSHGALAPEAAIEIGLGVAMALEEAHARGVIHRDIKPQNIFVTPSGVKVGDFGIARVDDIAPLTMQTGYLGTIAYSAPEQVRGEEPDARSDIYSLGAVLYEMCAGRPPFEGSMLAVMDAHLNVKPTPIQQVPVPVNAIIQQCLAKDAANRFQTASDLRSALECLVAPLPSPNVGTDATVALRTEDRTVTWPIRPAQRGDAALVTHSPLSQPVGIPTPDIGRTRTSHGNSLTIVAIMALLAVLGVAAVFLLSNGTDTEDTARATPVTAAQQQETVVPTTAVPPATLDPRVAGQPIAETIEVMANGSESGSSYTPSTISASAGELIEILVENTGNVSHSIRVSGLDGNYSDEARPGDDFVSDPFEIKPGETGRVLVKIDEPGSYPFRCDFHPDTEKGTLILE